MSQPPTADDSGALIVRITLYLGLALTIGLSSGEVRLAQLINIIPMDEPLQMVLFVFLAALTIAIVTALQVRTAAPPGAIIRIAYASATGESSRTRRDDVETVSQIAFNLFLTALLLGAVAVGTALYNQFDLGGPIETVSWFLGLYVIIVALTRRLTWFLLSYFEILSIVFYILIILLFTWFVGLNPDIM